MSQMCACQHVLTHAQAWVGSPAIYVFDCSAAGLIINSFRAFAEQRTQVRSAVGSRPSSVTGLAHLSRQCQCRPAHSSAEATAGHAHQLS